MEHFFKEVIIESKNKGLNTFDKQIEKYFKSNDFKLGNSYILIKYMYLYFQKRQMKKNLWILH